MQRPAYSNPAPAHSPPLHHPVPQHVSTVPQLRSPPPPVSSSNSHYGYAQQQQGQHTQPQPGGGYMQSNAFPGANFISDPTAQMGFQVGKSAVMAGHEYMEQNFNRYVNVSALKHYFNVSNSYVASKLYIVLFPWWHRPWSRQQRMQGDGREGYAPPREDVNSPDMYIPIMALVTYIVLSTLLAGVRGAFHPELLASTATTAFAVVLLEILSLKLGTYLLSISSESQLLDLVAYSGYKFVGIIVTLILSEILNRTSLGSGGGGTGGWVGWMVFLYVFAANAFFLLRSLRYVLLPDMGQGGRGDAASYTVARSQRNRRTQFLFVYSYVVQFVFMWLLSRQSADPKVLKAALGDR